MSDKDGVQEKSADFPELIELVRNETGAVEFWRIGPGTGLSFVTRVPSGQTNAQGQKIVWVPPPASALPWALPRRKRVEEYFTADTNEAYFEAVEAWILENVDLASSESAVLLTAWILHTFLVDQASDSPYILLSGPPESGKTRALNTCIKVARRGILTMNAREAALIRYAQDLKATIALDVVDLMAYVRPMQDFFAARTKNDGALTTRILDFAKGPFNGLQHYAPFGATLVASNTGLSEDWIVSRTLVISACRATRSFVAPPDAAKANDLRERGTAFRGRVLMALAAGKKLPSQPRIADGRLGDLLSGLVQAIMLTAPARLPELQSLVPSFTAGRKADVLESIEVEVLRVCIEQMGGRGEPQIDVRLVDLVREINWQRADAGDRALSSRKVAPLLRTTLGLETWAGAGNYTRVTLPAKRLSQLAARYGLGGIGEHVKVATARAIGRIAPAPAPRTVTVKKLRS